MWVRVALLLAGALVALTVPAPARADSDVPTIEYPLERIGNTVDVEVMIQAPLKAWGIRRAAKFYDAQVDGLTIHTRGTCAARPLAVCVRVYIRAYSDAEMLAISGGRLPFWHGITVIGRNGSAVDTTAAREIHLDTASGPNPVAARHELGHAIGLGHHLLDEGVMGAVPQEGFPSTSELDALRTWYALAH